jgi:predicted short-subunit dehydrogenase-like oxidoreductase (DUF2520 family)
MRIGIIGAGRVGCSLAFALSDRKLSTCIYGRNPASAEFAAQIPCCSISEDLPHLVEASDTVFIAVPDSSIKAVAFRIVQSSGLSGLKDKVFLHCSGALSSEVLECIRKEGGWTGSLHPIQSFPDRQASWKNMFGIYFGFEGLPEAEAASKEVVDLLDGTMLKINKSSKCLYHTAACVLSNYMVTLSHTAARMLEHAGIDRETGSRAFAPLLQSTLENINRLGSVEALTGPISRGDSATIAAHLEALEQQMPDETELYRSLGRETVLLALEKGTIDEDKAEELRWLLGISD